MTSRVPLHLSPFLLDDFEKGIRHMGQTPCFLIAEIHSCLVYNIRQVASQRNIAMASLYEVQQSPQHSGKHTGNEVSIDQLLEVLRERGNNWERAPLRSTARREGWQEAVIGLLKDVSSRDLPLLLTQCAQLQHATVESFPRLREVLTALLFPVVLSSSSDSSAEDEHVTLDVAYMSMSASDKIALISFLCDCSISSKAVRSYMEVCEEQLTQLRKEKTEVNRERKRWYVAFEEP